MSVHEQAFRRIQNDKNLYLKWCDAKTEHERTVLLCNESYLIGYEEASDETEEEFWWRG
jgi:hypothetical protein